MAKYEQTSTYTGLPFDFYQALLPAIREGMSKDDKQALVERVLADWDKSKEARFPAGVEVTQKMSELRLVLFTRRWVIAQGYGPAVTDGETQHG